MGEELNWCNRHELSDGADAGRAELKEALVAISSLYTCMHCTCLYSADLVRQMFTIEESRSSNVKGKVGKKQLGSLPHATCPRCLL